MVEPAWMRMARHFIGETEKPGELHNQKIVEMFRLVGQADYLRDEIPWCAAAVGACLSLAGYKNTQSALARSYQDFGRDLEGRPIEGCIVVLKRGPAGSGQGHVGFYAGQRDGRILVLGGNQGDSFSIAAFAKSRVISYRWPVDVAPLPETFLPTIVDVAPALTPAHIKSITTVEPIRTPVSLSRNFLQCHDIVARWEGGYVDHPRDPGGATNFGITLATLRGWRSSDVTKEDVKSLSYGEALEIFSARYWSVVAGDELPLSVALMTYNAAVNSGPSRAVRFLQKSLNRQGSGLDVDGEIGPLTIAACKSAQMRNLVAAYSEIYGDYYERLSTFEVFGRGWINRLSDVTAKAEQWISLGFGTKEASDFETLPNDAKGGGALTKFDKITGGETLKGWKTIIAVAAYLVLVIAEGLDLLPKGFVSHNIGGLLDSVPDAGSGAPKSAPSSGNAPFDVVKQLLIGFAGLSALSKIERGLNNVRKLPSH